MRILIVSAGSAGDVNPYIGLGRALVSRGHSVRLVANPHFEQRARQAGMDVVPIGTEREFLEVLHRPDLMHPVWGNFVVWNAIVKWSPDLLDALERAVEAARPDVIVAHHVAVGTAWVCRRHGIPRVTGALAPSIFLSPSDWGGEGRSIRAKFWRSIFRVVFALIGRPLVQVGIEWRLERIARSRGYPRPRPLVDHEWYGGDATLGLWSPALRQLLADDPPRSDVTGFVWFDEGHGLSVVDGAARSLPGGDEWPEIERFLDEGDPPVIFTLGSTAVHTPGAKSFFDMAAEACAILRKRGILLVGNAARVPTRAETPSGVAAFRYAPYSKILPRGCCSVIHGGIGSCGQAMRAGRPILVIPHAFDQFDNAKRLARLGIADIVPRRRVTVGRLVDTIERLLGQEHYRQRAQEIGRSVASDEGAANAARIIESFGAQ